MKKRATIKDVARESGMDISTVSRCLNLKGHVRAQTRERILAAAERLKYTPNRLARGLVTGASHTFGVIVSDIRNPFFAEVVRGVEDVAYDAGLDLVVCNSDLQQEKQSRYIHSLVAKGVDGIIVNWAAKLDAEDEEWLMSFDVPIVALTSPAGIRRLSTVSVDNEQGGFLAGCYLLQLSHHRLALLTGPEDQSRVAERTKGFLKAVEVSPGGGSCLVLHGDQNILGGYRLAWKVISDHADVTAIATHNDVMAFGALKALSEAGYRVPEHCSVMGFDDVEIGQMVQPALTTIHQPIYEIGQAACQTLLKLRQGGPQQEPIHKVFGVSLVERRSTAPRNSAQGTAARKELLDSRSGKR